MKCKKAFTIAEFFAALAIMGIIGVIVIPNMFKSCQQTQMLGKLRAAYTIVSNIIAQSEVENGPVSIWSFSDSTQVFNTYFRPYIRISKDCGNTLSTDTDNQCFYSPNGAWYDILRKEMASGGNGNESGYGVNGSDYYKVILKNGMSLGVNASRHGGEGFYIVVDVNGKQGKSIVGKDVFFFSVIKNSEYYQPNEPTERENQILTGYAYYQLNTARNASIYNEKGAISILNNNCSKNATASSFDNIAGGLCARALELNRWKIPPKYPW